MHLHDATGRAFPPVRFVPAERLSVAVYERVLHGHTSATPHPRVVPPEMLGFFLAVGADRLVEDLGFTWGKTLNVAIEVTSRRRVLETDLVEAVACVDDAFEKVARDGGVRQLLTVRADFRVADELAVRWRVTFIERKDGERDARLPDRAGTTDGDRDLGLERQAGGASPSTLEPGDVLPAVTVGPFTRFDLARLSVALDNPDPLHLDDDVARAAGFERVVGQGSLVVGLLMEPARAAAGADGVVWARTTQRAPYTLGDTLSATGEVTSVATEDGRRIATLATRIVNQDQVEVGAAEVAALGPVAGR